MQNLGGWQDDHAEEDVEESQRDLHNCAITGPHAERFAGGVLSHYPALVHLDLSGNQIGPDGAESLAGVLAQCPALVHLNLSHNRIGDAVAGDNNVFW